MLKYAGYDIVFQEIPDEVTLALNLSGCPNGCPGCHSPHLQPVSYTHLDVYKRQPINGFGDRYSTLELHS